MSVKVSVVVPVYNPGSDIERCIESLLRQTLSREEFEAVFVDDGCTDATPERLDKLAAEHTFIRVIHIENSGWPGKPRNIGVAAARGDYVQFLDQDDMLGDDALRRLTEMAERNGSDIVIGKVVSNFRGVPHQVFARNVERCTLQDFPLVDSLTPHKMFRREFLAEHGIAYPEGKRRLEDQLYMMQTYLVAKVVSIVGDYPCYYYLRREDGGNAGSVPIEPVGYYGNLREVLDTVGAGTEPGEFRNRLLRRFLRNEVLNRVSEPVVLNAPEHYRKALFDVIQPLTLERFDDDVVAGLPVTSRIRAHLVRQGRLDDLRTFAAVCADVTAASSIESLGWEGDELVCRFRVWWQFSDGTVVTLPAGGDGHLIDPRFVEGLDLPDDVISATADVAAARADASIRERKQDVQWPVPSDAALELAGAGVSQPLVASGTLRLDVSRVTGGGPLTRGTWDLSATLHVLGMPRKARLHLGDVSKPAPALVGSPVVAAIPVVTPYGNLTVDVDEYAAWLAGEVAAGGELPPVEASSELRMTLPLHSTPGPSWPARLTLVRGSVARGPSATFPGSIRREAGRSFVVADISTATGPVASLRPGTYDVLLHTGTRGLPPVRVAQAVVGRQPVGPRLRARLVGAHGRLPLPVRRLSARVRGKAG